LKFKGFILLVVLLIITLLIAAPSVKAAPTIELTPTDEHHIAELNSDQPYVAGYHVDTPDLYIQEGVNATAITVSFPSTDPKYFPTDSWLGAGMFVQAQDSKLKCVDYAFYTILVLDWSGGFFLDIGLHQTREATAPVQWPTSELIYAYTWCISGIDPSTPITLQTIWDSAGFVDYSLSASGTNVTFLSINVPALPNCPSIIRQFFAGTVYAGIAFPQGHYVYYFQFGVVSPKIIADGHWSADLKDPKFIRKPEWRLGSGWHMAETAWVTQGDMSYLDSDWMWGGAPYSGVSAKYHHHPFENPYEVIFFYNGQTLSRRTVLWQQAYSERKRGAAVPSTPSVQALGTEWARLFSIEMLVIVGIVTYEIGRRKLRKQSTKNSTRMKT